MGCYTGPHRDRGSVTVLNYAEGLIVGGADKLNEQINKFFKEEVVFDDMP